MTQGNRRDFRSNQQGDRPRQNPPPRLDISIDAILTGNDPKGLIDGANKLANAMTDTTEGATTQVRRLFSSFRQIEHAWPVDSKGDAEKQKSAEDAYFELVLFKPKLSYVASKHPRIKALTDTLDKAIDTVGNDRARLSRLMEFFEATVAYFVANAASKGRSQEGEQ